MFVVPGAVAARSVVRPCLTVGELLWRDGQRVSGGRILGVFHRGWYLETDAGHVWTVCDASCGVIPIGLGVEEFATVFPFDKRLEGRPFVKEGGTLHIPDPALTLTFACPPPRTAPRLSPDEAVARRVLLGSVLQEADGGWLPALVLGKSRGELPPCAQRADAAMRVLKRAVLGGDVPAMNRALTALIGLGPGLTPSMDDWLCGLLYAVGRLTWVGNAGRAISALPEAVRRLAPLRTNRISAAFLSAAAELPYFEQADRALTSPDRRQVERVLLLGSSSGGDLLAGIFSGLALYEEQASGSEGRTDV